MLPFRRKPDLVLPPASNSAESLTQLLKELAPVVRRIVHYHYGPRPDADDVFQEALIQIAEAIPRFRGEASLETYAGRITRRVVHRALRRPPPLSIVHEVPAPQEERDPESTLMSREAIERLYRCLERLPAKRREAFVLCAIERVPHDDAARQAGVSVETLRARLKRARSDLARRLAADDYLGPLFGGGES